MNSEIFQNPQNEILNQFQNDEILNESTLFSQKKI